MPASPRSKPRPESLGPVLDALPVGLYVVDRDLVVVAWNQRRELGPIGRPRSRAVGRPLAAVLGKAGFRTTEPVLREVLEASPKWPLAQFNLGLLYEEQGRLEDDLGLLCIHRLH